MYCDGDILERQFDNPISIGWIGNLSFLAKHLKAPGLPNLPKRQVGKAAFLQPILTLLFPGQVLWVGL